MVVGKEDAEEGGRDSGEGEKEKMGQREERWKVGGGGGGSSNKLESLFPEAVQKQLFQILCVFMLISSMLAVAGKTHRHANKKDSANWHKLVNEFLCVQRKENQERRKKIKTVKEVTISKRGDGISFF